MIILTLTMTQEKKMRWLVNMHTLKNVELIIFDPADQAGLGHSEKMNLVAIFFWEQLHGSVGNIMTLDNGVNDQIPVRVGGPTMDNTRF